MSEMSLGGPELDATAWKLIVLQPEIGLAEANELKITLLASLEEPAVELDASRVRQIGTAGVQLLVATALELQKRSRPLHISIASVNIVLPEEACPTIAKFRISAARYFSITPGV